MAKSTRHYVFAGMELLPVALIPFVEKRLESALTGHWQVRVAERVRNPKPDSNGNVAWDQALLLRCMDIFWTEAFRSVLGKSERSIVNELAEVRNKLSHNETFTYDDAERALDSMRRLMDAIGAGEPAIEIGKMRETVLRTRWSELRRNEERKKPRQADIALETLSGLKSWRDVVAPHQDVASGDFLQAEFAADLGKIHNPHRAQESNAPSEYADPVEFFSRTYLTQGLSALLIGAARRLSGSGGDPVVELQTNFGGGKTHSMLALYHMAGMHDAGRGGAGDLPGLDRLLADEGVSVPEGVNRAVMVGTSRGPQDIIRRRDGAEIQTIWGDLAWQLGGKDGFDLIADNDRTGVAPGSNLLEELFRRCAPSLILIDEWVAYLRQIYKTDGLPSGSFDANLTFVQSLTEAVKASPGTLFVASLPASRIEVGGDGGQEALDRLKQTFARVESSWRPASQEESYEIVRRRLFMEIPGDVYHHKENTVKQFAKLYRDNPNDFPPGCGEMSYHQKLETSYPIHPELFDQLYTTWGALEEFQRTRGVLRFMAQVIHELWIDGDPSVMIMPGSVAVNSARVEPELLHYLRQPWQSIIAGDVDGESSAPCIIDKAVPGLGRVAATRRVARTIFMGTAPSQGQENRGLDARQINLGVVQPGERPTVFGDALRRLADQARYMHGEFGRYWYSETPSLNRIAADRAVQFEDALILSEIDKELARTINGLADRGEFDAVQVAPRDSAEVPDEAGGVRAVVFGIAHPHSRGNDSAARNAANTILMQRGNMPRVYRNMLIFLAPDDRKIDSLKDAMRMWRAWESIVRETERLNLTQSDSAHAKSRTAQAAETLQSCLKEAWCCLLYPSQPDAQAAVEWTVTTIAAQDGLLARASQKLVSEGGLLPEIGPDNLNQDLQKYIWNDKPHLRLQDVWLYLNRYMYLPRLKNRDVLIKSVRAAIEKLIPGSFAYAERWDQDNDQYIGLLTCKSGDAPIFIDGDSVIVAPDIAAHHSPAPLAEGLGENAPVPISGGVPDEAAGGVSEPAPEASAGESADEKPRRFIGTVMLSSERPMQSMDQILEAVIGHLTSAPGSEVSLKLEIDAEIPGGLDRDQVRTILENANTLGFIDKELKRL